MDKLLKLYHRGPYPLRVAMASARGYYLRWLRYGAGTEEMVNAYLERDRWTPEQWRAWREERLGFILHRAVTHVPYYRDLWAERRRNGDKSSYELLENWPVLTKDPLRDNPLAFVAEDVDVKKLYIEQTSGTTGKPITLYRSRDVEQAWYTVFEARTRRWNGLTNKDPWAIFGGQLVAPFEATKPPFWVWNAGSRQLYLSSYHISSRNGAAYAEAMRHYKVRYLLTYPSSADSLARIMEEQSIEPPKLKVIITNAEQLYPEQRETIQRVFGCPVVDMYGTVETVTAASECSYGRLHLWPEVGVTEILSETTTERMPDGESGRLIGTGLLNPDNILIRYQLGDRASLEPAGEPCPCGRPLPAMGRIDGRMEDVVLTPDGRRIGRLSSVFRGVQGLREAQVVQEQINVLRVKVIPAPGFNTENANLIVRKLHERVGDMDISVETVDSIPRFANGKYKMIVSKLPSDAKEPGHLAME